MKMDWIENKIFDEIQVGDTASLVRTLQQQDIELFAIMSGDINPAHLDVEYAKNSMFHEVIAHGMWGGALISTVLGTQYPGPGTIYLDQSLHFSRPVTLGDTITVSVTVSAKYERTKHVVFDCKCFNQDKKLVVSGTAEVLAPTEKIKRPKTILPEFQITGKNKWLHTVMKTAVGIAAAKTAVVHPCSVESLQGALEAAQEGLIIPYLVGPKDKIRKIAMDAELDLKDYMIIDVPHSHAAAAKAVAMARANEVELLMKGSLHTDELLGEVVSRERGLRTNRRLSHVFAMEVPTYEHPLLITDAAINISPNLEDKVDIIMNAIEFAHALGIVEPKVAILSAVETVTSKIRSTLDAAALCKMADRGQITGGILDGPLAFDNAISLVAAKTKGIKSAVAGRADILVVPDLESGNMLAKQLQYLANALAAGIVLGARVPIVLTSRSDNAAARIASSAVALLRVHHDRKKNDA
jgi:phosphate acetyltransferase